MRGVPRIIIFCSLTMVLPTILLVVPLYLRHSLYANVVYTVAESDIMEIEDGISTIFCSEHTLKMNTPFNAFKVSQRPKVTSARKHIRLKKSMTLPDDTLEYWGFYLLKGSTVALSVCSRFQGASILVVKGERSLRTCGMMEHNEKKRKSKENHLPQTNPQVEVVFQSHAQEINSRESHPGQEMKETTPSTNLLISSTKNQTVFTHNKIGMSTHKINPISNKKNQPIIKALKTVNVSELGESTNSLDREINLLHEMAINHIQKHISHSNTTGTEIDRLRHMKRRLRKMNIQKGNKNRTESSKKHLKSGERASKLVKEKADHRDDSDELHLEHEQRVRNLEAELNYDPEKIEDKGKTQMRYRRAERHQNGMKPPMLLDQGIEHGGNAINHTKNEDSSISSFENGLLTCYHGHVLLAQEFEPSELCTNISFLENSKHIQTQHNITHNGYYYYIFYSDNDFVSNDMHAVFDIYKPTLQYENLTQSCINKTECSFSLGFLSGDHVIVEVPTRNGIDDTEEDLSQLISTCHPRMGVYSIFPITVLLLVLGCAFM